MEEIEKMKELVEQLDKDFEELKENLCTECKKKY